MIEAQYVKMNDPRQPMLTANNDEEERVMTGTTSLGDAASGVADAYVEGPGDSPLLEITIGEALRQAASDWPQADALISSAEGVRWSFADFDARVDRLAAGLLHLGLRCGDRVAILAPNCAAWTLLQFATARAGLVFVTFNTAYRRQELAHVLALSQARALVSVKGFKDIDYAEELAQIEAPALEWRIMLDEPAPEGWLRFDDISSGHLAILDDVAPDPRDAVNIQFTSGTTGRSEEHTSELQSLMRISYAV